MSPAEKITAINSQCFFSAAKSCENLREVERQSLYIQRIYKEYKLISVLTAKPAGPAGTGDIDELVYCQKMGV